MIRVQSLEKITTPRRARPTLLARRRWRCWRGGSSFERILRRGAAGLCDPGTRCTRSLTQRNSEEPKGPSPATRPGGRRTRVSPCGPGIRSIGVHVDGRSRIFENPRETTVFAQQR